MVCKKTTFAQPVCYTKPISPGGRFRKLIREADMSRHHTRLNACRWDPVRRAVFERDHFRCVGCGSAGRLEADHVTPLQREPGQDVYVSIAFSCRALMSWKKSTAPSWLTGR